VPAELLYGLCLVQLKAGRAPYLSLHVDFTQRANKSSTAMTGVHCEPGGMLETASFSAGQPGMACFYSGGRPEQCREHLERNAREAVRAKALRASALGEPGRQRAATTWAEGDHETSKI
jgi:hypothetical protein